MYNSYIDTYIPSRRLLPTETSVETSSRLMSWLAAKCVSEASFDLETKKKEHGEQLQTSLIIYDHLREFWSSLCQKSWPGKGPSASVQSSN